MGRAGRTNQLPGRDAEQQRRGLGQTAILSCEKISSPKRRQESCLSKELLMGRPVESVSFVSVG